jgi:hypothetical protein
MKIFISTNGQEEGPLTMHEVREKIYRGDIIESQTIAKREKGDHWVPLRTLIDADLQTSESTSGEVVQEVGQSIQVKPQKVRKSLKAKFSFALMFLGAITLPTGLVFIIASLILGFLALRDIKKSQGALKGIGYINASRLILCLLLIIMATPYLWAFIKSNSHAKIKEETHFQKSFPIPAPPTIEEKTNSQNTPSVKDIFNKCSPLIVSVESFNKCGFLSKTGSGVILGPSKAGFITPYDKKSEGTDVITNFHVIDNSYFVLVRTKDGKIRYAQIIAFDRSVDLALIRIHGVFSNKDTPIAKTVGIGDPTIAIGNPEGLDQSISTGIVSHLPDNKNFLVQTTAPISHGSSGGGLFNQNGDLIGITSSTLESGQNLNFAIWLQGALLQAVQETRIYEGHIWNDAQASWLKIPYAYGKYPYERFVKETSYLSAFDPDEDILTLRKSLSPFKSDEDIIKYVKENTINPKFTNYSLSKRSILKIVERFDAMSLKILQNDRVDSDKAHKMDGELLAYRDKQLLPAISSFYSEFPYDETIATMFVKYVQDPTTKENLLKSNLDRWPYSLGQGDSNWLYQYINLLLDLGKIQKAHDVLSQYTSYILQQPTDYTSDDDQTSAVLTLFKSDTACNRTYIIRQSLKQFIESFPDSIKGISFRDIKDQFLSGINHS